MYPIYSHMTAEEKEKLPKRKESDFYPTEHTLIHAFFKAEQPFGNRILDPGAADGRWGRAAAKLCDGDGDTFVSGIDLRQIEKPEGFDEWFAGENFIDHEYDCQFDIIAGNPPYGPSINGVAKIKNIFRRHGWEMREPIERLTMSEMFVRKGLQLMSPSSTMAFLLPLNFMTGIDRFYNLFTTNPPSHVYALARRPSFYDGRTNSTDYGIFVWRKIDGVFVGSPRTFNTIILNYERKFNQVLDDAQELERLIRKKRFL